MNTSALTLAGAAAIFAVLTAGCSAASSAPSTIQAHGTITSSVPASLGYVTGGHCEGMGNDHMQTGKEFKIQAEGKTLAMGKLPDGVLSSAGDCEFKFSAEVPAGLKFYTLDLGEWQGHKEFSEADIVAGITIDRVDLDGRKP